MKKEKIMNKLMDIRELTGGADVPVSIEELNGDLMAIRNISSDTIKELNSKPVMPVIFDSWYKNASRHYDTYSTNKERLIAIVEAFNNAISFDYPLSDRLDYDNDLRLWFCQFKANDGVKTYKDCINAVINGYEVEK